MPAATMVWWMASTTSSEAYGAKRGESPYPRQVDDQHSAMVIDQPQFVHGRAPLPAVEGQTVQQHEGRSLVVEAAVAVTSESAVIVGVGHAVLRLQGEWCLDVQGCRPHINIT